MKANIYRRFPLELQRYRKHFGPLLCPCPRWISILWFFWKVRVEKYPQNDRNYLPVQYIFLHGHPDCWGRVRPLGKKSFQIVFTKLTMIISIVLESESSDRVKHGFCIYIWFLKHCTFCHNCYCFTLLAHIKQGPKMEQEYSLGKKILWVFCVYQKIAH